MSRSIDPRYLTLAFSAVAAVAAGTPYLYGVYSPQLIKRCGISAENAATISFASNLGSGLGGFPAGMLIDKYGVRFALILGSACILLGYGSLYNCYNKSISSLLLLSVSICSVGFGSITSYFACLKACTLNFPHNRGTAGAFAVSSFGLSALVFSAISAYWFPGDTQGLLKFLSLTCGGVIAFSSIFVKLFDIDEIEELDHQHDEEQQLGDSDTPIEETDGSEIERSEPQLIKKHDSSNLGPFLNAHRGSLAQINFNESATSLFSYASSIMSRSGSFSSSLNQSASSSSPSSNQGVITVPSRPGSINNLNNNYFNSSPTSSRLSGSPNTSSSSPQDNSRIPFHHRNSSSKGVYFGIGGNSPRNSFSNLDKAATLKKDLETSVGYGATNTGTTPSAGTAVTASSLPLGNDESTPLIGSFKLKRARSKKQHTQLGHVKNLITDRSFLLHYLIVALLSAIGQLYIYSIGFIVRALVDRRDVILTTTTASEHHIFVAYLLKHPELVSLFNSLVFFYSGSTDISSLSALIQLSSASTSATDADPTPELYQALQVSVLAFGSFVGRLLWGPLSDIAYKTFKYQRLWLVILSAMLIMVGQFATLSINDVSKIALASIFIGTGYGSIFGVYPAIIADQFGSKGFTTSWGLICTGPLIALFFLTKVFGQNIDRMSEMIDGTYMCIVGKRCYDEIFKVNVALCIFVTITMCGLIYLRRK